LGQILVDTLRHYEFKPDVVMPVPLHASRFKERGYNQSELLAKPVAAWFNIAVDTRTLQRVRQTKTQMELNLKERHQNVLDAFACRDKVDGQKVLLIDDVCTTGSTLDACAAALKQGGAAAIWGLTLARAHLKN
jgi:ComF family protein